MTLGSVNLLRLGQVKHVVHIQPYTLDYLRLALPTGACLAAAVIVHSATSQSAWYVGLVATGLAAGAAYLALLPVGLPARERTVLYRSTRRITNLGPR